MAATLYYLADEGRFRKVANALGIGKSLYDVRSECDFRYSSQIQVELQSRPEKTLHYDLMRKQ